MRTVEPSPHDPATAYVAATRYKLDDNTPYLYKTTDYGETWHSITGHGDHAVPDDEFVRVIRTDPAQPGLLFVGTETGLYVSTDDGNGWHRWESNLPVTPIYDIEVKEHDLVLATHGRSFWVLDDLTPLHQLIAADADDGVRLFTPRRAWRLLPDLFWQWISTEGKDYWLSLGKHTTFIAEKSETGHVVRTMLDAGQGAPVGVTIAYTLDPEFVEDETHSISLAFLDAGGRLVREFHPKPKGYAARSDKEKDMDPGPWIPVEAGVNRFLWDLRYAGSDRVLGNKLAGEANTGPLVVPGTYSVELRLDGVRGPETLQSGFEVVNDPRSPATMADLERQLEVLLDIRDKISEAHNGITRLRSVRTQVKTWAAPATGAGVLTQGTAECLRHRRWPPPPVSSKRSIWSRTP